MADADKTVAESMGRGHGGPAKGEGAGGEARGYSWTPMAPTHGAYSPELVEPRAREMAPQILAANQHLDERRDGAAVLRYAMVLARCERVYAWLADRSDQVFADIEAGETHGVFGRLEAWEKQAARAEDQLAISPLTRTKLGLDKLRGHTLADMLAAAESGRGVGDA